MGNLKLNEDVQRPDILIGKTYKVRTPIDEDAMYITINDIILNEGTEDEIKRLYLYNKVYIDA